MMKNKKLMLVLVMVIFALVAMMSTVKATNELDIQIITDNSQETNTNGSNATDNNTTTNDTNNVTPNLNNTENATETNNATNNETLPQTGVEENTIVFVAFIAIFTVAAVYAYKKIRDYKNI